MILYEEEGLCDECQLVYELPSREDHCVEEGLCWRHCKDAVKHYVDQRQEIGIQTDADAIRLFQMMWSGWV